MNTKAVAYLLAPCILSIWLAGYAVISAIQFTDMTQDKPMQERHRKDAEIRQIVAASIAKGDPFPSREKMLEELDDRDKKMAAWQGIVVDCASCMRQMGISVLLVAALQVYLIFRFRAHCKKIAAGALAPP